MQNNIDSWKYCCSKEKFLELKVNPVFITLVQLSRVINSLRFCQVAGLIPNTSEKPSDHRQCFNSFLFASGVLYEGILTLKHIKKKLYKNNISQQNSFLKDKRTKELEKILHKIRNKIVFHFDEDVITQTLNDYDCEEYIFACGDGSKVGDVYYLSDELIVKYLVGDEPSTDRQKTEFMSNLLEDTAYVSCAFTDEVEKLFLDILPKMGFKLL